MAGDPGHGPPTASNIAHVVLIVEENHTFDSYFGRYCTAGPGSNPTCTTGRACCEAAPMLDPAGVAARVLDDEGNRYSDREHGQRCELCEIGRDGEGIAHMDHFADSACPSQLSTAQTIVSTSCSDPANWALAPDAAIKGYWDLADRYALADRYFQPIAGSTSSNDMYFAGAHWQFNDNDYAPCAVGGVCASPMSVQTKSIQTTNIADLLLQHGNTFGVYADGYAAAVAAATKTPGACPTNCPSTPGDCPYDYPFSLSCQYDASDIPFEYYPSVADDPRYMHDWMQFVGDVMRGALPDFAYLKLRSQRNEHPGFSTLSEPMRFVGAAIEAVMASPYADSTLILLTWDEGGGFYDHVPPPAALDTSIDQDKDGHPVPYGTRVPLIAIGKFARRGTVSHEQLEHSSVVRFLEYNFLGPSGVGALGARDKVVNNLGSLLDSALTGGVIP
jgi:phospholipase C